MTTKQEEVKDLMKANNVLVFSKTYCPYCTKAKNVLNGHSVEYKVVELDERTEDGGDLQSAATEITSQRTVPMIWIGGKFIGGSSDLEALENSGELAKMLEGFKNL